LQSEGILAMAFPSVQEDEDFFTAAGLMNSDVALIGHA
jgi:hypothetical protein